MTKSRRRDNGITINDPAVVSELTTAFFRFETALTSNDVATLNELYWRSPLTVRFGIYENLYGHETIAAFRQARLPRHLARTLKNTVITTYGRDFGTANTEFVTHDSGRAGRHTHTWMRTDEGWRIVAAHLSWLTAPAVSPMTTR